MRRVVSKSMRPKLAGKRPTHRHKIPTMRALQILGKYGVVDLSQLTKPTLQALLKKGFVVRTEPLSRSKWVCRPDKKFSSKGQTAKKFFDAIFGR